MFSNTLDTSLVDSTHGLLFLGVFILGSLAIIWERRSGHINVGASIAILASAAAWLALPDKNLATGLIIASIIVIIVGKLDEHASLKPATQLIWQIIIAVILVVFGWTIPYVSNPFAEGVLSLDWISFGAINLPADLLMVVWIVLLINAINWIDGSDGLAGGITSIAFVALAAIALLPSIQNPTSFSLAIIGAAITITFFIWNAPPAKVYLGTVGSWFLGLYLALAAIYGGGKIATSILILALPLLDAAYVVVLRIRRGEYPWVGDTVHHLHHRFRRSGVSNSHILAAAMVLTAWLAILSILVSPAAKLLALGLGSLGIIIAILRLLIERRNLISHYDKKYLAPRR